MSESGTTGERAVNPIGAKSRSESYLTLGARQAGAWRHRRDVASTPCTWNT